jgi:hypothetical protein
MEQAVKKGGMTWKWPVRASLGVASCVCRDAKAQEAFYPGYPGIG